MIVVDNRSTDGTNDLITSYDRELQERCWKTGGEYWFDPDFVVHAEIQTFRLKKEYHRRWHFSHGELHALLRDPEFEKSAFRVFNIPGHVLRRAVNERLQMIYNGLRLRPDRAFGIRDGRCFFDWIYSEAAEASGETEGILKPRPRIPGETSKKL